MYGILWNNIDLERRTFDEYEEAAEYRDFSASELSEDSTSRIEVVKLVPVTTQVE